MSFISQADNNMAVATVDFFDSAWNLEQSDYFFLDATTNSNDSGNLEQHQLFPRAVVDDEMRSYSIQLEQSPYQRDGGLMDQHSNDDTGQLLTPRQPFLQWSVDPENGLETLRAPPLHDPQAQDHSRFDVTFFEPGTQYFNAVPTVFLDHSKQRQTTFEYGQISPGLSPEKIDQTLGHRDSSLTDGNALGGISTSTRGTQPTTVAVETKFHTTAGDAVPRPDRKLRRSKKTPLSKEQEQDKRKEFLERNRKAADKCRQNRKKLMDHLQEKRHEFKADNDLKKAAVQTMEDEIVQLKKMLMVHSQSCKVRSIQAWVENEADRSQQHVAGAGKKECLSPETVIDGASPTSSSSSMGVSTSAHVDGPG